MKISAETRGLAGRLLTYESAGESGFEPWESATLRVFEKLRTSLIAFAGVAAFQSLAKRALSLAKQEATSLGFVQVTVDGSLRGLPHGDLDGHGTMQKSHADRDESAPESGNRLGDGLGDGGAVLIAYLLGLLLTFLGEALTLRLLHDSWPEADFNQDILRQGRRL